MLARIAAAIGVRGFVAIGLALVVLGMGWRIHSQAGKIHALESWQAGVLTETADALGVPPGKVQAGDVVPSLKQLRQAREAAEHFAAEGAAKILAGQRAVEQQAPRSKRLEQQAERIRAIPAPADPPIDGCTTSEEILHADL